MMHYLKLLLYTVILSGLFSCRKTLTLVCSEATMVIKDDVERHMYSNRNFGSHPRVLAFAWTTDGLATSGRGLLRFDLSEIPANKSIRKATLKLFGDTTVQNELTARLGGRSNGFYIKRVTENWDENSVSWNTQPAASTEHQVVVPQSVHEAGSQDYSIDVTALIRAMGNDKRGIMLQLVEELSYARVSFASDDAAPEKRPVLTIIYR